MKNRGAFLNHLRRSPRGFTLVECLVASALLAVASVGILLPLSAARQQRDVTAQNSMAVMLGRQLIEEIAAHPLSNPVGGASPGGGDRSRFSYADDYDGYSDSTLAMQSIDGTALDFGLGSAVFQRSVSVVHWATPTGTVSASGDFALLSVTVTPPSGIPITLNRLLTRTTQTW